MYEGGIGEKGKGPLGFEEGGRRGGKSARQSPPSSSSSSASSDEAATAPFSPPPFFPLLCVRREKTVVEKKRKGRKKEGRRRGRREKSVRGPATTTINDWADQSTDRGRKKKKIVSWQEKEKSVPLITPLTEEEGKNSVPSCSVCG